VKFLVPRLAILGVRAGRIARSTPRPENKYFFKKKFLLVQRKAVDHVGIEVESHFVFFPFTSVNVIRGCHVDAHVELAGGGVNIVWPYAAML
jgi:hypothetical protein